MSEKMSLEVSLSSRGYFDGLNQRPAGLWDELAAGATLLEDHADRVEHHRTGLLEILTLGLDLREFGHVREDPALASILVDDVEPKRAYGMNGTAGADRPTIAFAIRSG